MCEHSTGLAKIKLIWHPRLQMAVQATGSRAVAFPTTARTATCSESTYWYEASLLEMHIIELISIKTVSISTTFVRAWNHHTNKTEMSTNAVRPRHVESTQFK